MPVGRLRIVCPKCDQIVAVDFVVPGLVAAIQIDPICADVAEHRQAGRSEKFDVCEAIRSVISSWAAT